MNDEPESPKPTGNRSNGKDGVVHARYDWSSTSPSTAVVETVAVARDCEPTMLDPLYEYVDPEALDTFVRSSESPADARVSFDYDGLTVTVRGSGDVVVRDATD